MRKRVLQACGLRRFARLAPGHAMCGLAPWAVSGWALMLNWIRAVSGAVANLPSAPTKTVLGSAVSVGAWAMANAARVRTVQRMRAVDFIGFLQKGKLYTGIIRTREMGEVA